MQVAVAVPLLVFLAAMASTATAQDYTRPVVKVPDAATSFSTPSAPLPATRGADSGAQPSPPPAAGEQRVQCIPIDSIREAKIRDDRTIQLKMRGGLFYEMRLQNSCPGLSFYDGFYYRTTPNRQLCSGLDMIMARSGSRCPIDSFVRIDNPQPRKGKDRKTAAKEKAGKGGD